MNLQENYPKSKILDIIMTKDCCSVTKSCLTLCDPMNYSRPGVPALHYFLEFAQTQVHWVDDAIQLSHPLLPTSPPALNLSQHQGLSNESALQIRWPKYWSFRFSINLTNEYSGLIFFIIVWFDVFTAQGTLKSPPALQFESINSFTLSFLYGPTLTSVHEILQTVLTLKLEKGFWQLLVMILDCQDLKSK